MIRELTPRWRRETSSISSILLEDFFGLNAIDVMLNKPIQVVEKDYLSFRKMLLRLQMGEPIQYVLGVAHFFGRKYMVNRSTLIPRQETEELVQLVVKIMDGHPGTYLDIGTGSGCIAISLALELPGSSIHAVEADEAALKMAKKNAELHQVKIHFHQVDILQMDIPGNNFDLVVSNPPYVTTSDSKSMDSSVIDWEPFNALFVDDSDPLLFYREIARQSIRLLREGGWLCFEINEAFGDAVCKIMTGCGFHDALTVRDIHGKDRFVYGSKG